MKKILLGLGALALMTLTPALGMAQEAAAAVVEAAAPVFNAGNTAWVLAASALVMLMTPGLAFFYAGMVARKNVVSTLLQNYAALAVVGLLWIICGYSLVFTPGNNFIGDFSAVMLTGLSGTLFEATSIPMLAFVAFQMMFAIITPALITGAFAERVRFRPWLFIMGLWSLLVYVPVAHWVWGGGFLADLGALDFAGGFVVHITAGFSALVIAFLYGKRTSGGAAQPNDIPMVMLGAALLWFGWFGFNAGSSLAADGLAAHAFMTTFIGAAGAMIAWMCVDWIRDGKPTAIGGAIGLVAGLVAVTPGAGFVDINSAFIIAITAGIVCNLVAKAVKQLSHMDDALDVFACHAVGGVVGSILTGVFASSVVNPAVINQGIAIDGTTALFSANMIATAVVAGYSMIMTFVIVQVVKLFMPIRATVEEETIGLDHTMHGEVSKHNDRTHA